MAACSNLQVGSWLTQPHNLPRGRPLWKPQSRSALRVSRVKGRKAMRKRVTNYPCRRTVRITKAKDEKLREFAAKVGIPVSEYMRRLFFGDRPIVAKADDQMIKELRRLGGLLKHNFGIIREGCQQETVMEMNKTLRAIQQMMDNLGGKNDPEEI